MAKKTQMAWQELEQYFYTITFIDNNDRIVTRTVEAHYIEDAQRQAGAFGKPILRMVISDAPCDDVVPLNRE